VAASHVSKMLDERVVHGGAAERAENRDRLAAASCVTPVPNALPCAGADSGDNAGRTVGQRTNGLQQRQSIWEPLNERSQTTESDRCGKTRSGLGT
jgi:hypothetical protein